MRYLILLCLMPSAALALEFVLQVDGETSRTINADSAAMAITDGRVVVDVRTGADPAPGPDPDPVPDPGPPTCQTPQNVTIGPAINWAQPGGQRSISISRPIAWPFRATGNPGYWGQVSTVEASSQNGFRRVWISRCPLGEPIGPRCESRGRDAVVRWAQSANAQPRVSPCVLTPNERYHVNVGFVSCETPICRFFMNIYTNGKP